MAGGRTGQLKSCDGFSPTPFCSSVAVRAEALAFVPLFRRPAFRASFVVQRPIVVRALGHFFRSMLCAVIAGIAEAKRGVPPIRPPALFACIKVARPSFDSECGRSVSTRVPVEEISSERLVTSDPPRFALSPINADGDALQDAHDGPLPGVDKRCDPFLQPVMSARFRSAMDAQSPHRVDGRADVTNCTCARVCQRVDVPLFFHCRTPYSEIISPRIWIA